MTSRFIQVLHLEDSPADAKLIAASLAGDGLHCQILRVEDEEQFRRAFDGRTFDVILADHQLPSFDGVRALQLARELAPRVPFISVSGALGEEVAVEVLRNGATDYVLKHRLSKLGAAVRRALNEVEERARRERAEIEVRSLEEQLRHAQRLEAIGRLAGGIAHDFNNLLTIINGYGEQVLRRLPPASELAALVEPIQQAGARAATLTRRLLAFSRRQVFTTKVVSLNDVVAEVCAILPPLLGEDVSLVLDLDQALHSVRVDTGQIEHVILNLASNARDAMPGGGTLTIRTFNVDRPQPSDPTRTDRRVGLSVADTGHGMDAEVRQHIFEPFFTTKASGHGTGLGLPTVYGIVTQSGGEIHVESEPGRGTTMSVLLPSAASEEAAPAVPPTPVNDDAGSGHETILLVEDEQAVRELVREFLRGAGYRVLEAGSAPEAEAACRAENWRVDLLVSDVVLPGVNGPELAERLRARVPGLRTLFVSGYPGDAVVRSDAFAGSAFLAKPFSRSALLARVRDVLEGVDRRATDADLQTVQA